MSKAVAEYNRQRKKREKAEKRRMDMARKRPKNVIESHDVHTPDYYQRSTTYRETPDTAPSSDVARVLARFYNPPEDPVRVDRKPPVLTTNKRPRMERDLVKRYPRFADV